MLLQHRRSTIIVILFATLIGFGLFDVAPAIPADSGHGHGDLLGSLKSLIYSYNQLDNKLERHEHRERALGELLKKAMQSLQKGQKSLEPIHGIFTRLDDRVSQIETNLISQEEKYNIQTEKLGEALEYMFKWMRENDECYKRPPLSPNKLLDSAVPAAPAVSDDFMKQQDQFNQALMTQLQTLTTNVQTLIETSKQAAEQTEVADMLTKIEDKLISYTIVTPAPTKEPFSNKEFEEKVFTKFDEINNGIAVLQAVPKAEQGLNSDDKIYIQTLTNETLNALEHVKIDLLSASDKALAKTTSRIMESEAKAESNLEKILEGVTDSAEVLDKFYTEVNSSYTKLNDALEVFNKFNAILMTNSEYVLDTQRKVEFATFQVVQKLGDLLEKQRDDVMDLFKQRFDNVDETMLNNKLEATKNLSDVIDTEIGHVWRRIEIMGDEITASTDLLKMLNGRNEVYVNSTFSSMDSMSAKVELIKERMQDMDSNLNFLLGKLSVMSQEFGNIKIGLAESLEELRNTFQTMQEKMPTQRGPGPHNIARNEYETELNLLNKRHTN